MGIDDIIDEGNINGLDGEGILGGLVIGSRIQRKRLLFHLVGSSLSVGVVIIWRIGKGSAKQPWWQRGYFLTS